MTIVEPADVPFEQFPSSTVSAPGEVTLEADLTPRHATAVLDVPYAQKSGQVLRLQILLPPQSRSEHPGTFPAVLYVQGSAWLEQNLGLELPALADVSRRGYLVAIVEYRPSTVAPFPAQVADAKTAIRYLRAHAADYHLDPERVAVWGDSSGGHTAVLTALTADDHAFSDEPVEPAGLGVRCCVDYYGPTDVSRMNEEPSTMDHRAPTSPEGLLIGGLPVLEHPEAVAPTVAMNHIRADRPLPPVLIVHGSKDRLVPYGQSVLLYEALRAAGQPVQLYRLEGADHGGPPFWQPPVLDLVDTFLRQHLAPSPVP